MIVAGGCAQREGSLGNVDKVRVAQPAVYALGLQGSASEDDQQGR